MALTTQTARLVRCPAAATITALVMIYGCAAWASAPEAVPRPAQRDVAADLAQTQVVRPPGTEVPPTRTWDQPNIGADQRPLPEVVRPPSVARRPADAPAIGTAETPDAEARPDGPQPPADEERVGRPHQCVAGPPGAVCN